MSLPFVDEVDDWDEYMDVENGADAEPVEGKEDTEGGR